MTESAGTLVQLQPLGTVSCKALWLYLAVLVGLYYLLRWYRERQVVSHLWDKFVLTYDRNQHHMVKQLSSN